MTAVLDTSAAVRLVLNPREAAAASRSLDSAELVVAPQLMLAEATNTFWKYVRSGHLSRSEGERGLHACVELVDEFVPMEDLCHEVFGLSALLHRPAYDMFFLALARRIGAVLITADAPLQRLAADMGIPTE